MSKQQIIDKIEHYTAKELEEISAVLEQFEQKRAEKPAFEALAGAWADIDDVLYSELTNDIRSARQRDKIGGHHE